MLRNCAILGGQPSVKTEGQLTAGHLIMYAQKSLRATVMMIALTFGVSVS
jgi:hypothetical protein